DLAPGREAREIRLDPKGIECGERYPGIELQVAERLQERGIEPGGERGAAGLDDAELLQGAGQRAAPGECRHVRRAHPPLEPQVDRIVPLRLEVAGDVTVQ